MTAPTINPIIICTVKDGRYHGRHVFPESVAVIAIVINTASKFKTARVPRPDQNLAREEADVSAPAFNFAAACQSIIRRLSPL